MTRLPRRPNRASRRASRRGSTAVIVALCMMVMLAFVALGVDWGAVSSARAELQIAADAAATAGASGLPTPATAKARAIAYANQVSIRGVPVELSPADITIGSWNKGARAFAPGEVATADAIKVVVHYELELPISSIFGYPSVTLTAQSGGGATTMGKVPDLVIVQDVTPSFADEIARAKKADKALVDCIHNKADPDSQVGLVAFSGLEKNLLLPNTLVTYGSSYSTVTSKINSIQLCGNTGMPACQNTNHATAFHMANAILTASTSPPEVGRAVLLISDGAPVADTTVCNKSKGKYATAAATALCPGWGNKPTIPKIKASTLALRDTMEAKGYDIYTVFYNETSDPVQTAFMNDLTANKGIYLETPDPDNLGELLAQVCHAYTSEHPGLLW